MVLVNVSNEALIFSYALLSFPFKSNNLTPGFRINYLNKYNMKYGKLVV